MTVLEATTATSAAIAAVCGFGMGNGIATLVRATAIADAYGAAQYGSVAGVAAALATGARAVAPVAATSVHAGYGGYRPLLWLMAVGAVLASVSAGFATGG